MKKILNKIGLMKFFERFLYFIISISLERKQINENIAKNLFYLHAETTAKMYRYPFRYGSESYIERRRNHSDSLIDFPY